MTASPLSAAVPLEGTDTVLGLRALEQSVPAAAARQSFAQRRRYRGPYLEHVTLEQCRAPPKPWRELLERPGGGWRGAYSVPPDWDTVFDRAEENLVLFLPNYLRVIAACFICVMYMAPLAVVGLVLMFLIWDYMRTYTAQRHLGEESWEYKAIYFGAHIAMWVVALKSRGMLVLTKGGLLAALVVGLHASGKVAPCESRHPLRPGGLARLFSRGGAAASSQAPPTGGLANLARLLGLPAAWAWLEDQWWLLTSTARDAFSRSATGRHSHYH